MSRSHTWQEAARSRHRHGSGLEYPAHRYHGGAGLVMDRRIALRLPASMYVGLMDRALVGK